MTDTPEDATRNPALSAALDEITAFATRRMDQLEAETGTTCQFLVIADDGEYSEMAGALTDYDAMAESFNRFVEDWAQEGLLKPDDDEPLFTATFDPQKVRPS